MDSSEISLLVIAGGRSSRMGEDKRWLELDGVSMLERLLRKAQCEPFRKRYLCVEAVSERLQALAQQYELELLVDESAGAGPMEGLRHGLQVMPTDYALAVSCDMPLFTFAAAAPLLAATDGTLALVAQADGRRQPLASLYHRDLMGAFAAALASGQRKIGAVLAEASHKLVELTPAEAFFNVNTPADLRLVRGRLANRHRPVPLITVSAPVSNTGKTTFIERLIPQLRAAGIRAGVVKGDCHGFDVDVEGKDSWRFQQAGAESVAVVSPNGYFIQRQTEQRASLLDVANQLQGVDLVLIESRNHGTISKLSLWRGLGEPVIDEDTAALFTSNPQSDAVIHQYGIDEISQATALIRFLSGL